MIKARGKSYKERPYRWRHWLPATSIRSIAIIDPLGDTGIGSYVYELAEGLAANQRQVDVYTNDRAIITRYPLARHHRVVPVLGSALFRQRETLRRALQHPAYPPGATKVAGPQGSKAGPNPAATSNPIISGARGWFLSWELAVHLRRRGYDLVWTQWPEPVYGVRFHWACRRLGLRVAHTVHNILPHEEAPGARAVYESVYRNSDWLLVHSQQTRSEMEELFPEYGSKVILVRHGLYTMYPQASEGKSELRKKLGIPAEKTAMLFFGGIRPYKNIDAVLGAMADERCRDMVLVVAGSESGYADLVPGDRRGRTRRRAAELGIADRVLLINPPFDLGKTAELMEATDVLLLPYRKSYGSGLLLLGLTFGKHIVATRTGGMEEYLEQYPRSTLLGGTEAGDVAEGIERAVRSLSQQPAVAPAAMEEFQWPHIARRLLENLQGRKVRA